MAKDPVSIVSVDNKLGTIVTIWVKLIVSNMITINSGPTLTEKVRSFAFVSAAQIVHQQSPIETIF